MKITIEHGPIGKAIVDTGLASKHCTHYEVDILPDKFVTVRTECMMTEEQFKTLTSVLEAHGMKIEAKTALFVPA